MPLEEFRSRETIQAAYFDGSLESALEVARLFPSRLQIEFTGDDGAFLLRAVSQAAFLPARNLPSDGSGLVRLLRRRLPSPRGPLGNRQDLVVC
jgi:hypothetical protein